ncbi:MAG: iron ABC transporter permease [Planctomycetota bacterium]
MPRAAGPGRRTVVILSIIGLLLVSAVAARLLSSTIGFGLPRGDHAWFLFRERLEPLATAAIVGVALALSGVCLQALLRNPLAEPYILGLSTGAGLGIMLQGYLALTFALTLGPDELGALIGSGTTLCIVYLASRRRGVIDRLGLLLAGVVLSTINGSLILLMDYLAGPGQLRDNIASWMMGQLAVRPFGLADVVAGTIAAAAALVLYLQAPAMDIATLEDDEAASLGVAVGRLRVVLLLSASLLAACAVVVAGPIAFVGLIAPHLARTLLGPAHRPLILGSAMIGATLLIAADTAAVVIAYARPSLGVIPVGIFTAMIGGPAFLWMLRPQLGRGME